jgi:hypothetical protein
LVGQADPSIITKNLDGFMHATCQIQSVPIDQIST